MCCPTLSFGKARVKEPAFHLGQSKTVLWFVAHCFSSPPEQLRQAGLPVQHEAWGTTLLPEQHSSCMGPELQVWCAPTVHAGAQEPVAVFCLQPLRILRGGPTPHNRGTLLPSLAHPSHLICLTAVSRSLPHHPKSTSRSNFLMLLLDEHRQTPLAFSLGGHFGSI